MKIPSRPTRRRPSGVTLIELTVVILVLLALMTTLFIGARAWKKGSDRTGCIMNIRNVQQAVRSHQNLNGLNDGATIDVVNDLVGPEKYLNTTPVCPGGGTYTFASTIPNLGDLAATCSLESSDDHVPDNHAGW